MNKNLLSEKFASIYQNLRKSKNGYNNGLIFHIECELGEIIDELKLNVIIPSENFND